MDQVLNWGGVSGWALVGIVILTLIKVWPALKKLQMESDGSLRTDLMERIDKLEKTLHDERQECTTKITELQNNFNGLLRQFILLQVTTGVALPPESQVPVSSQALDRLIERLGFNMTEHNKSKLEEK